MDLFGTDESNALGFVIRVTGFSNRVFTGRNFIQVPVYVYYCMVWQNVVKICG